MSTRASLIYDNEKGLHIYQELLDNTVHIEVEKAGMLVDVEIMSFTEWVSLGLPKQSVDMAKRRLTMREADLLPCGHRGDSLVKIDGEQWCAACGKDASR